MKLVRETNDVLIWPIGDCCDFFNEGFMFTKEKRRKISHQVSTEKSIRE